MKNKHIMVISDHADPLAPIGSLEAGGQNIYVLELAKILTRYNWFVDVFTRWDNSRKREISRINAKSRVIRIKAGPLKRIPRDEIADHLPEFTENIIKFKSRENINYCLIHANYWMSGWIGLRLKKVYNLPLIQKFHSLGHIKYQTIKNLDAQKVSSGFFHSAFMKNRLAIEKELFRESDAVLASSPFEKREMIKYYEAPLVNIKIIPLGIDPEIFKPIPKEQARRKAGWPQDQKILLYVGRIEWRKGIGTFLYALHDLIKKRNFGPSELSLKIIGGHPKSRMHSPEFYEFQRLRKIIEELKLGPYVSLLGSIKRKKLPYYYSAADVVSTPSYYEPFGLVVVEAMACGTPVIGSRVGGIQFTIKNEKAGFLVPPRRHWILANKILTLLANPKLGEKMGREAVKRVRKKFNNHLLGRQMNYLIKQLIK